MKKTNAKKELTLTTINPLIQATTTLTIKTSQDMSSATALLSNLNKQLDKITEEKERVTKPMNEALKAERARWKPAELALGDAIATIRSKMSTYQSLALQAQKQAQEDISAQVSKGKIGIEQALTKLDEVNSVDQPVETASGTVKFRETKVLKIINEAKIPRAYLVPNEKAILEALKAGQVVPGCELEIIQTPINYR